MAGNSENLGQVAGIFIGQVAPQNTSLIWWDSTPSQRSHKIYDFNLQQWVILSQEILSPITYNELKNLALSTGLPLAKFYVVTDLGNILALSITSTKVQYVNASGNLLVDDLGSNIQYYISSNNLTIDGVAGIFTQPTNRLNFNFKEEVPELENYILGKKTVSSVTSLFKFKISSLLSAESDNNLKWKSGFFVNIKENIADLVDKVGGIVSYDAYSLSQSVQDQSIENIANNYSSLVSQTNKLITNATTNAAILGKTITALNTGGVPVDAAAGDSIFTVLSKFQRYINKFKLATGINISANFSTEGIVGNVNPNDNVETAIAKLVSKIINIKLSLPENWEISSQTNQKIEPGNSYDVAFGKIEADRRVVNSIQTARFGISIIMPSPEPTPREAFLSINNGILELEVPDWNEVVLFYTRVITYDYTRFFRLEITQDLVNLIGNFIPGFSNFSSTSDRGIIVQHILSVYADRFYDEATTSWISPKSLSEYNVSFGYDNVIDSETGLTKKTFGLLLSPKLFVDLETQTMSIINKNTTVQSISKSNSSINIPPLRFRYKLV